LWHATCATAPACGCCSPVCWQNSIARRSISANLTRKEDIHLALQKLNASGQRIDNYIFITTETIDADVLTYAQSLYDETGGIEFVILDCIGFIRHFLHLFHRLRTDFLETYQALILAEPQSAVSQPVKEAFLAMRQAAESGMGSV
jgi:DNA adenine methylase